MCERAATQPRGPRGVCQQITKPPLTTPGDRLTLLPHHGMGYSVPHTLAAAQILQPAETSPLPMSQGAGLICIGQGNPDVSRLWGHQSRGWWPLCHQIHLNLLPSCRSSTGSGREGAVEGTVTSGSFLLWVVVPFFLTVAQF